MGTFKAGGSKSTKVKKVATNLPATLLKEATKLSGLNQTQAIIAGLLELISAKKRDLLLGMRGKVQIDLDLNKVRGRLKAQP